MTIYRLEELFPAEIEKRLKARPILILPFGTIEWHSHHLPLGLDGIVAQKVCERIADRIDGVLAPVSYWAAGGVPYPFTLDLPIELVEPLLEALFEQFGKMGFSLIVAFTGHFSLAQTLSLKRAALVMMQRTPLTILPLTPYDMTTDRGYLGDHAGKGETSLLWAIREDLVRLNAVPADQPLEGIIGADPRGIADLEWGKELLDLIASRTGEMALRLLNEIGTVQRKNYIRALAMGVQVLGDTFRQRQALGKSAVPTLTTPAYLEYCRAIVQGDYQKASANAKIKLKDLSN